MGIIMMLLRKSLNNLAILRKGKQNELIVSYNWDNAIAARNICEDFVFEKGYDISFQYERIGTVYSGPPAGYQTRYYRPYSCS